MSSPLPHTWMSLRENADRTIKFCSKLLHLRWSGKSVVKFLPEHAAYFFVRVLPHCTHRRTNSLVEKELGWTHSRNKAYLPKAMDWTGK